MNVSTPATIHSFDVHGIRLRIGCTLSSVEEAISHLLERFSVVASDRVDVEITIAFPEHPEAIADRLPPAASLLFSRRKAPRAARTDLGLEFDVYETPGELFVDLGDQGMMIFNLARSSAQILLSDPETLHTDLLGSLLLFTISEIFKSRGLHLLHSAAVALDGRAVIIPGTQGRGKTTTCIALLARGFSFMSDDVLFLREKDNGIEACALPERLSVTEGTIALFPEIRDQASKLDDGLLKKHFAIEDIFPGETVLRARPAIVLFPEVTGETESRLESIPRARALELLLPRGISVLDRSDAKHSFQLLAKLVAQSVCYRFSFGTRMEDAADLVRTALSDAP